MALIYKLKFPDNPFINIDGEVGSLTASDGTVYLQSTFRSFPLSSTSQFIVPREDINSKDLKVSTKLEDINSKITYDLSFIGNTARDIIQYIEFVRLPKSASSANGRPAKGLEYLFNLDKQIKITIEDDCCAGLLGRKNKIIVDGFIPLNTVRYCEDTCSVSVTIYEDGARVNALKCLESTVLGLRSNIGKLQAAEILTDFNHFTQTGIDTRTKFATVQAKWFDVCIEPTSPGFITLFLNLLGWQKIMITFVFLPTILAIAAIILVINGIIAAINIIPGVNVTPITNIINGDSGPLDLFDDLFGLERIVEGLYGCRYVRGSYRVASIITTACNMCGFSVANLDSIYETNITSTNVEGMLANIVTPITPNPFVANGSMNQLLINNKKVTYNTAYMPAEEAYKRRKETSVQAGFVDDIAIRGASIETVDKIFDRLSSLFGNSWNVVNTPVSAATPKGIQLQLGSNETRYSFRREDFVNITDMEICYKIAEGTPIGYSTTWQQDSSDISSNKQLPNHNGYITYFFTNLSGRKSKNVKNYNVEFAPSHYIGSLKDDSVYDDLRANRTSIIGFTQLRDFFVTGTLIQGTEFTSVPKLIQFNVAATNVLDYGKTCRLDNHNSSYSAAYRMSSVIYTSVASTTVDTAILQPIPNSPGTPVTGIQSLLPHYSVGYFGENKNLPNTFANPQITNLLSDYLKKYGSSEVEYNDAVTALRSGEPSFLGPFNNTSSSATTIADNIGYKFAPLLEFTVTLDNYTCGQDDLFEECVTSAVRLTPSPGLDDITPHGKLRLVKLSLGLGVVTELEIDYENRKIEASGYVIPFVQNGIDYSV
jgi:hypothetical protein